MRALRRAASAAAILAVVFAHACFLGGKNSDEDAAAEQAKPSQVVSAAINRAELGDSAVCAATGETFAIDLNSRAAIYHGRRHYFKNDKALQAFLADPAGFFPDRQNDAAGALGR